MKRSGNIGVHFSSQTDLWETPLEFFKALDAEFGFVTDVCALPENASWLVQSLPSLNTQEAVVVGDGVTVPVHIRFNDLEPEHRPAGADPSFAVAWRGDPDETFLDRAIDRWRRQTRE